MLDFGVEGWADHEEAGGGLEKGCGSGGGRHAGCVILNKILRERFIGFLEHLDTPSVV